MYLLNTFFVYSILGFIVETLFAYIFGYNFSSGILYGPWTPIYGLGAVIIIVISEKLFKNLHKNRIVETIIVFFVISIILLLLEWLGGILIENIFHVTFWDYSDHKFNIGKYISLEMGLLWGVISIIMIYVIRPLLDSIVKRIPWLITILVSILFIIDIIVTFITKINA